MKRSKFTEEQVAYVLRQAESGTAVEDFCRSMDISQATFYIWKKKYGELGDLPLKGEDYLTREINMKALKLFLITFLMSGMSLSAHSQQSSVPSHCTPSETVFLTAKMKRSNQSASGVTYTDTGKIVSLCADQAKDPIGKLTYRYGPIGKVEMEHVASPSNKLGNASIQSGPRMSEDFYFFSKGNFTYYIIVAGGMGSGVSLAVFDGNKRIVNLFSGNEESSDFQLSHKLNANAVLAQRNPLHANAHGN